MSKIFDIIKSRRAVYPAMYSGKPVPNALIEELLEAAHWAPSHKHTEPWRFVVFTNNGIKKLADYQALMYKNRTEKENNYSEEKYQKLLTKPLLSSHIIAVGAKGTGIVPHLEDICATACAVQNLWLAASANGLGCYWSTGGVTTYQEAKPFFGLSEEDTLLGFIHLGMVKKDDFPKGRRGDLSSKVTWVV